MASELRVNSSTNRSGLGTITYTDSGPIVSGVGTFANGLTVDGTQTTVKSLKLTGDSYNVNWFKTTHKLRFNDNAKATFGTSDDLSIFHNASDSVISQGAGGTGNLKILSGGAQSIECIKAGAVNIAFNGSTKLTTTNTGAVVTGISTATEALQVRGATSSANSNQATFDYNSTQTRILSHNSSGSSISFFTNAGGANVTQKLLITSDGKIGINEDVPQSTLHVASTSNYVDIGLSNSTSGHTGSDGANIFYNNNLELALWNRESTGIIRFATAGTERFRIASDGKFYFGNQTVLDPAYNNAVGLSGSGVLGFLSVCRNSDIPFVVGRTGSDGNLIRFYHAGVRDGIINSDSGGLAICGTSHLALGHSSGTEVLRIDSNGRVLIGSTAKAGDSALQVYTSDRLHPAIRTNSGNSNGYTMFGDAYQAGESQVNIGISYSSASLVLSQGCKVNTSNDDAYVSSQGTYSTRPNVIRLDTDGSFSYHSREASATTPTDNAVTLTELFKIDRVGNVYQRISGRNIYLGASNQLRLGVQTNGDPNIEAVSGDLKFMKAGSTIMQLRADGFEMKQDIYFGTAGKGIVLGNTSNVDANTLDSYEEGTFTPTILNGWGILNSNPNVATGKYVRIGAIVYIYFSFKEGSGTGASFNGNRLSFYNFPYQAEGQWPNSTNYSHPLEAYTNSASSGGENIIGLPSSNGATVFSFVQKTSSGYTSFTGSNLGSSGQLFCAGVYRINGT